MAYFKSFHIIRTFSEIKSFMNFNVGEYLGRYHILRKPYYVWREKTKKENLSEFLKPYFEYKQKGDIIIITKILNDEYYNNENFYKFSEYL